MKEAREKSTMASCSRRFLTSVKRDTAVDAVDLESRNKFRWDLLLQHAVRSLVLQTLIVSLCLDLDLVLVLVHPHYPSSSWKWIASCNNNLVWALKVYYPCIYAYTCCQETLALDLLSTKTVEKWYKAFTQQKSKLCAYISSLLIFSYLLILTNFCPGEANFLAVEVWKFSFPRGLCPLGPPTRALPLDPTRAYAAPGHRHFQKIFYNAIYIPALYSGEHPTLNWFNSKLICEVQFYCLGPGTYKIDYAHEIHNSENDVMLGTVQLLS